VSTIEQLEADAQSAYARGDLPRAAEALGQLLRLRPDDPEVLNDLGAVCFAAGRVPDSIRHLRRAVQLDPRHRQARSNLLEACQAAGLSPEAVAEGPACPGAEANEAADGSPWRVTFLDPVAYSLLPLWQAIRRRAGVRCQWAVTREPASRDMLRALGAEEVILTSADPRGPELARFVEPLRSDVIISSTWGRADTIPSPVPKVQTFHGLYDKRYYLKAGLVRKYALLLLPSHFHKVLYVKHGLLAEDDARLKVIGWPRIDCFARRQGVDRERVCQRFGLDPTRRTVFYAPTWAKYGVRGIFCRWFERQFQVFARLCEHVGALGANLVIKFHPLFQKQVCTKPGFWRTFLHAVDQYEHVRWLDADQNEDPQQLLHVTDVLITDLSSIFADFLTLDRPVVFIEPQFDIWESTEIFSSSRPGFIVEEPEELMYAISDSLENPRRFEHERRRVFRRLVWRFDGLAAERGADEVMEFLRKRVPQPAAPG